MSTGCNTIVCWSMNRCHCLKGLISKNICSCALKKKIINFKKSFQSEVENKNGSAESFKPLYRFEKRDVDAYVPTCQEGNERGHRS